MNGPYFDALLQTLTQTRRATIFGALAAGLVGLSGSEAKKKHKRKHKKRQPKATPNAYGCLEVGDPCASEDDCCSGICEGKKGKRTCRAHDTGHCDQDAPGICFATNPQVALCASHCFCIHTTAGSKVCGESFGLPGEGGSQCADCQKDADCMAQGFPAGTACVPIAEGSCAFQCEGLTACVIPCVTGTSELMDE